MLIPKKLLKNTKIIEYHLRVYPKKYIKREKNDTFFCYLCALINNVNNNII